MSLTEGSKVLASDFVALKARVKAEMARRCRKGSLAAYATDYTDTPTSGGRILPVHANELIEPLNQINTTGYTTVASGDVVPEFSTLDAKLTAWEATAMTSSTNDCSASCSGLCTTGCYNSCSGCGGACSSGCSSCSGTCTGGCEGCSSCSGTCSGGCSGSCTDACSGCGAMCSSSCSGYCSSTCTGGCYTSCSSCGTACSSSCTNTCTGGSYV